MLRRPMVPPALPFALIESLPLWAWGAFFAFIIGMLALDLGGTQVRAALVRPDGTRVGRSANSTPVSAGPAAIIDACIATLRAAREAEREHAAVGVGAGGGPERGQRLDEGGDGVGADLEDFDVEFLECIEVLTEPQDLVLSSTREGERQKGHDGPFALVTGKRERLVQLRGKREPWSDGARRECRHERSP